MLQNVHTTATVQLCDVGGGAADAAHSLAADDAGAWKSHDAKCCIGGNSADDKRSTLADSWSHTLGARVREQVSWWNVCAAPSNAM